MGGGSIGLYELPIFWCHVFPRNDMGKSLGLSITTEDNSIQGGGFEVSAGFSLNLCRADWDRYVARPSQVSGIQATWP